jgi:hypothetical protein
MTEQTTEQSTDDLASLVAIVIGSTRSSEEMRDNTGVVWDDVIAGVEHLKQRGVLREVGVGQYHVAQSLCAGPCSRGGSDVRGQEVVINPNTFRWMCAVCWDAGEASVSATHEPPAPGA